MRRIVDLPHPDGPTSTMNSPSPISKRDVVDGDDVVAEDLGRSRRGRSSPCRVPPSLSCAVSLRGEPRHGSRRPRGRACAARRGADPVQSEQRGADDGRRDRTCIARRGADCATPSAIRSRKRRVVVAEDPAAEHHVDVEPGHAGAADRRGPPCATTSSACRSRIDPRDGIAAAAAARTRPAGAARAGRVEPAEVHGRQDLARARAARSAAGRRRSQRGLGPRPSRARMACHSAAPPMSIAAAPVARDRPERGEPGGPAVGRHAGAVDAGSADHADAPRRGRCRRAARRTCRCARAVIRDLPDPQPTIDPAVVDREVGAGQAVDAELGDGHPIGGRARRRRWLPPRRR